ncbi:MAG: hypothetical protein RL199_1931 [Pseudomonadota bacterium]|jgi:hypothetical protein
MAALVGLLVLVSSTAARAHASGVAYLDLSVEGRVLAGALDLSATDVAATLALDADGDGLLSKSDVERSGPAAARWLASSLRVVSAGAVCAGEPVDAVLRDDQLLTARARWTCPTEADEFGLYSRLDERLGEGHALYVHGRRGERVSDALLLAGMTEATLSFGTSGSVAGRFVLLGLEHIFTGLDHILFLVTLLLLGGSLRRVAGIVTAFTAAHSLTLSIAVLGVVRDPPTRLVESAIAASIAWVSFDNLRFAAPRADGREPAAVRWRWLLTFAFGLVHGFGFAGALRATGLPEGHIPLALGTFNLGVEAGQLAIVLVVWPLLRRLAKTDGWRPRGVRVMSGAALVMAAWWFVQRAVF